MPELRSPDKCCLFKNKGTETICNRPNVGLAGLPPGLPGAVVKRQRLGARKVTGWPVLPGCIGRGPVAQDRALNPLPARWTMTQKPFSELFGFLGHCPHLPVALTVPWEHRLLWGPSHGV